MAPINGNINSDVQLMDLKNDDPNHYLLVCTTTYEASKLSALYNTE